MKIRKYQPLINFFFILFYFCIIFLGKSNSLFVQIPAIFMMFIFTYSVAEWKKECKNSNDSVIELNDAINFHKAHNEDLIGKVRRLEALNLKLINDLKEKNEQKEIEVKTPIIKPNKELKWLETEFNDTMIVNFNGIQEEE